MADGPIWPLHWAFRPPEARYGFAPERAAERLERAGFRLRAPASADAPRSRFTIRCLFWSEDAQYERIALMIERQLFDIGIDVTLEPVTLQQLRTRVAEGDFDTFLIRTNASRALDITYRFWRSAGEAPMQRSGYTGADELLDALQRSTSDEEVRRVGRRAVGPVPRRRAGRVHRVDRSDARHRRRLRRPGRRRGRPVRQDLAMAAGRGPRGEEHRLAASSC